MPNSNLLEKEDLINILDSLQVGIVYVDNQNRFAFINKSGEEIRKIKSEERIGSSILECHNPKIYNRVLQDIQSFNDGDYSLRHKMIRANGRYFDNLYSVVKDNNGDFKGVALLSQDVTEKKELEEQIKKVNIELERKVKERTEEIEKAYEKLRIAQLQLMHSEKMAAIGQFVSGLAHEINNPLDGIQNCIRSVLQDLDNKKQAETYLPLALEGLFRIEILVKRLLDYARPHSNEKIKINVNDLIEDALELTKLRLNKKRINVTKEIFNEPLYVFGEPHYLNQVFINIILNAFDALLEGGQIGVSTQKDENGSIKVIISDNGSGIPKDIQKKIFEPFFTTKQKSNGTGLGLYLSYNVINEHGGKILLQSEEGKGSKFIIKFPEYLDIENKNEEKVELIWK